MECLYFISDYVVLCFLRGEHARQHDIVTFDNEDRMALSNLEFTIHPAPPPGAAEIHLAAEFG